VSMNLSSFLGTMLALSVAVERIVEILKVMLNNVPIVRLLFTPAQTQPWENVRCALLYVLSGTIGGILAGYSGVNILPSSHHLYLSYAIAGLLSSGGSAFWNHALDLMQAAKVEKEQAAVAMVESRPGPKVMGGLPPREMEAPGSMKA